MANAQIGTILARSLFEYKGNPVSFDCTEEQLAIIIQGAVDWADETRESFELESALRGPDRDEWRHEAAEWQRLK